MNLSTPGPYIVSLIALFAAGCSEPQPAQIFELTEITQLAAGDSHSYEVDIGENQFVGGVVDQMTVNAVVTVLGPDGEEIDSFDWTYRGPEEIRFETGAAGAHQVVVTPFEEESGEYTIGPLWQEPIATTPEGKVDQIMSWYGDDTPGGVVAVTRGDEITFSKSYGLANIEYGIPNTTSTPWHMASVSKQFTAMAIVLLHQEGLLDIDNDVRNYLPELPEFGHTITLRHLLNHTSGLRDHWTLWTMRGGQMDDVIRQEDIYRLVLRQRDLNFEPGSEYLYSNTGYMLLSEVVSKVSEQPFGKWMKENIFDPLEMHSTQIYDDHTRIVPGRAYSYQEMEEGMSKSVLSYANSGATSLFTTAEDLAKWLVNFRTGAVGGAEAIDMLQVKGVLNDGEEIDYALGIGVGEQNGLRRLSHGGADAGYRTWLAYYPEIDAGVIVLGNKADFVAGGNGIATADAFFAEHMTFEDETDEPGDTEEQVSETPEKLGFELSDYTGRYYSHELETFYNVNLDGDSLSLSHLRHGVMELTPKEADTFSSGRWFIGQVKFERNEDNTVHKMSMSNGRVRNLVFEKVQ